MRHEVQTISTLVGMSNVGRKQTSESEGQLTLLQTLSPAEANLVSYYPTITDAIKACTCDRQPEFIARPETAFKSNMPTLAMFNHAYQNENAAQAWLIPQLVDLSEQSGCRDKLTDEQIRSTAKLIAAAYPWLKMSELLLFFGWFKLGRYGKFFGNVDPMVITSSLMEFVHERANYILKIEQAERERKEEEERRTIPTYTHEEWLHLKELKQNETEILQPRENPHTSRS